MKRKIGEIFEYNGEWYQCVEGTGCYQCAFNQDAVTCLADNPHCTSRSDRKDVFFKKLEKVGEPHFIYDKIFEGGKVYVQNFKVWDFKNHNPICDDYVLYDWGKGIISIEIKQNKEDMKEKEPTYEELLHYYHSTVGLWAIDRSPQEVSLDWICDNAFQLGIDEKDSNSENIGKNLREFDLEAAKAGKPVCTRDGRKARIICFDKRGGCPIIALVETFVVEYDCIREETYYYTIDGREIGQNAESKDDLMMLPEKKEGWVNVYPADCMSQKRYPTKEEALSHATSDVIDIVKIEWEE